MMDLILRHPGYRSQTLIAATIVCQALLTLIALRFRRLAGLRAVALAGSLPLLWLAASALKATFCGVQVEGYILLLALALIVQVMLTMLTLMRVRAIGGRA